MNNISDSFGGGIWNFGSLLVLNSEIRDNDSLQPGGGIANFSSGTLTVVRSVIHGNSGDGTGGVFNFGVATIIDSTVANNEGFDAGGIQNAAGAVLHVYGSAITGNRNILGDTSAIVNSGTASIINTTIAQNVPCPTILNAGTLELINSTIADNDETGSGVCGALSGFADTTVQNTIIARNGTLHDCGGVVTSLGNTIIGDPSGGSINLLSSDLTGDAGLGDFADGIIPLLRTSPAIDAANPSACPALDQRGLPRVDETGTGVVLCDIGAVEFIDHVVSIKVSPPFVSRAGRRHRVTIDVDGTPEFDAIETIDVATVRAGVTVYEATPIAAKFKDVDNDGGDVDVRLKFRASDLGVTCDSPIVALTARTLSGETVTGSTELMTSKSNH